MLCLGSTEGKLCLSFRCCFRFLFFRLTNAVLTNTRESRCCSAKDRITDLNSSVLIQLISEIKDTTSQSLEIKLKGTKIQAPKIYSGRWPCQSYVQDQTVNCLATWSLHVLLLETSRIVVKYMIDLWWPLGLFRVIYSVWGEKLKDSIIPKEILDLK